MATVIDTVRWSNLYQSLNDKFKPNVKPRFSNQRLLLTYDKNINSDSLFNNITAVKKIEEFGGMVIGYTNIGGHIQTHATVDFGSPYENSHNNCQHAFDYVAVGIPSVPAKIKVIPDSHQWIDIASCLSNSARRNVQIPGLESMMIIESSARIRRI